MAEKPLPRPELPSPITTSMGKIQVICAGRIKVTSSDPRVTIERKG